MLLAPSPVLGTVREQRYLSSTGNRGRRVGFGRDSPRKGSGSCARVRPPAAPRPKHVGRGWRHASIIGGPAAHLHVPEHRERPPRFPVLGLHLAALVADASFRVPRGVGLVRGRCHAPSPTPQGAPPGQTRLTRAAALIRLSWVRPRVSIDADGCAPCAGPGVGLPSPASLLQSSPEHIQRLARGEPSRVLEGTPTSEDDDETQGTGCRLARPRPGVVTAGMLVR